ncbi:MAG TPA: putative addiction module antidote protein [Elusimicrobia bacterium]|nr:MAG: putative addiction module antidote protein [Elusimicrobia bacterium GWA2_64_40]HAN05862.1 putative addiction module antidote protein [Elusimicrobiota bacterium]HAU88798.1 putative addiction module antidote protein [Elusimicrobiota bacterium]
MKKYRSHDDYLDKALKDPKEAALYLNAAAEENDPALMLAALAQVVRAHGVTRTAKGVSLSRAGIYKTISSGGNPELKTFMGILKVSGLRMVFKPAPSHRH